MLTARTVLRHDGMTVSDVACRHAAGRGADAEPAPGHGIVFVRRGCFVLAGQGGEALLDPTLAYFTRPGLQQRFDHPHEHGDDCTAVMLDAGLAASLFGGDPDLPDRPVRTPPRLDLAHRLLLAAARRSAGAEDELAERALLLAAGTLEQADAPGVAAGRPVTARARRRLVEDAREVLAGDPGRPLRALASDLAVSPHHLSRVFGAHTGATIARHRMRLRARAAMERLAGGERDLARLAADVGFADQAHLCRVVRAETGTTPAALRAALAPA